MKRPWTTTVMAALGAVLLHSPGTWAQDSNFNDVNGVLGAANGDLVFTPVVPCRIIDSRIEGGRLVAGTPRDYDVAGALGGQGGAPNCAVPEGAASAVVLNFVAVGPVGNGNLRAWPFGQPVPIASVINYTTGVNIANGVVIGICDPGAGACAKDFTVRADSSDVNLVVDVMGYFSRPEPVTVPWTEVTGKPTGFADDVDNDTQYTPGTGLFLSGTTFSVNSALVQSRVALPCLPGSSIRIIEQSGNVICEPDDNTTYTGSAGVTLTGTNFTADTSFMQRRVVTPCGVGSAIRSIDVNGIPTCEADNDTIYAAGFGVNLTGTTFSADTAEVQRRVTTTCPSGMATIDAFGGATCAPRIQSGKDATPTLCNTERNVDFDAMFASPPSVVVTPQGLAATAIPPNSYCVVDEITTTDFNYCCFGSLPDSVSWIAMAPTQ